MSEEILIKTEQVDDVPLLIAHAKKMGLPELLDKHFPAHGNWQGLTVGWVTTIWLTHIISEADHRLNHVQAWAKKTEMTLRYSSGQAVKELDFTDDRLEVVLGLLSEDEKWRDCERALNKRTIRVYALDSKVVRSDSTTALGYRRVTEDGDETGLWHYGFSKDKRPDLPQLKVNMAALDPLGIPLLTAALPGQVADDPLYLPTIKEVQHSLSGHGVLYVGDSKMGAIATRGYIAQQQDYYLCPLSLVQLPQEDLDSYITSARRQRYPLEDVYRPKADSTREKIAQGYRRTQRRKVIQDGQAYHWTEQLLVVRSLKLAIAQEKSLRERLAQAKKSLEHLPLPCQGKPHLNLAQLEQAAADLLVRYKVTGLLVVNCQETTTVRQVRRYKDRPAHQINKSLLTVTVRVAEDALNQAIYHLGWRVYATNAPPEKFSLEQAVLAYRQEFIIERAFGRLKGKPLSLSPVYLERDDYATGLVRLLSLGLRMLTLLEFTVRRTLQEQHRSLAGLYAGNPKRTTPQPTAELLLAAFASLYLTVLQEGDRTRCFLTALSPLQLQILELVGFSSQIYLGLTAHFQNPP